MLPLILTLWGRYSTAIDLSPLAASFQHHHVAARKDHCAHETPDHISSTAKSHFRLEPTSELGR